MTYRRARLAVSLLAVLAMGGVDAFARAQESGQGGPSEQTCQLTIDRATIDDPLSLAYDPFNPGMVTVSFEFNVANQGGRCDFRALVEPDDQIDEPRLYSLEGVGEHLLYDLRSQGPEAGDASDASATALGRFTPGKNQETLRFELRLVGEQAVPAGDYGRRFRIFVQPENGDTGDFEEDVLDVVVSVASALGIAFEPRFPGGATAAEILIPELGLAPAREHKSLYVRANVAYELLVTAHHGALLHEPSQSSVMYRVNVNGRGEVDGRDLPAHFGSHPPTGNSPRRHNLSVHVPVADAIPLAGRYAETLTITVAASD